MRLPEEIEMRRDCFYAAQAARREEIEKILLSSVIGASVAAVMVSFIALGVQVATRMDCLTAFKATTTSTMQGKPTNLPQLNTFDVCALLPCAEAVCKKSHIRTRGAI